MDELIDWHVAERVATRAGSKREEREEQSYRYDSLEDDFAELVPVAESLVEEATGLAHSGGPARALVTGRAGWAMANIASLHRLLGIVPAPARRSGAAWELTPDAMLRVSRLAAGAQVGTVLGWMSGRVLGQYDILLIDEAAAVESGRDAGTDRTVAPDRLAPVLGDPDTVYFVGPNVVDLERRYAFPSRPFRLWLAIHELTHRAQFMGVHWLRDYFQSLVREALTLVRPDPGQLLENLRWFASETRSGRNPLMEIGAMGLVATPAQRELLARMQALMSLLEGHGDAMMEKASLGRLPEARHFAAVLDRRRAERGLLPERLLRQALGLEAKLRQYAAGERFVKALQEAGGDSLVAKVWQGPAWLPSLEEIRDPRRFIKRVGSGDQQP